MKYSNSEVGEHSKDPAYANKFFEASLEFIEAHTKFTNPAEAEVDRFIKLEKQKYILNFEPNGTTTRTTMQPSSTKPGEQTTL